MAGLTRWIGNAKAVAQVRSITPGGTIGTETFTITINGKTVTYTAESGDTVADVVDGLIEAIGLSESPEFLVYELTDNATNLYMTDRTAGRPSTITSSATGSATCVAATVTASSGPNYWSVAANWSGGAVPSAAGDDSVHIVGRVPILYGIDQNTVTLAELVIGGEVEIGLPPTNDLGYDEYLDEYLKISATSCEINSDAGLIRLNVGSVATSLVCLKTGSPSDDEVAALTFLGSGSNVMYILSGDVGIAQMPGETAKVTTLGIGAQGVAAPTVYIGEGTTLAATTHVAGTTICYADFVAWTIDGGIVTGRENCTGTTITVRNDGELVWQSSGNIGTKLILGPRGVGTFDRDLRTRTVAATDLYAGCVLNDRFKTTTWTGGWVLKQCSLDDVDLNVGFDSTITRS